MMPQNWKEKLKTALAGLQAHLQGEKARLNLLVLLGLAGMALLCLSEWLPSQESIQTAPQTVEVSKSDDSQSYAAQLEQRLESLIAEVEGAGRCRVMVTLSSGEETVYATDTEQGEASSRSEHVLLNDQALVERVQCPGIQGVAVVCEGGGSSSVQNTVTQLVQALTGIGSNHITVTKMVTSQ